MRKILSHAYLEYRLVILETRVGSRQTLKSPSSAAEIALFWTGMLWIVSIQPLWTLGERSFILFVLPGSKGLTHEY